MEGEGDPTGSDREDAMTGRHAGRLVLGAIGLVVGLAAGSAAAFYHQAPQMTQPAQMGEASLTVDLFEWGVSLSAELKVGDQTLLVRNTGSYPHALTITGGSVVAQSGTLRGGQETTMAVKLEPGQYELYCPIPGHREAGMLTVVSLQG